MKNELSITKKKITILLVIGFILGLVCGYFLSQIFIDQNQVLERLLFVLRNVEIVSRRLFRYCFFQRLVWFLPIIVGIMIGKGKNVSYLSAIFCGISWGMICMLFVYHFQLKGMIWFLFSVSPQIFFLVPGYIGLYANSILLTGRNQHSTAMEHYEQKYNKKKRIISLFAFVGVVIVGVFIESYINIWLIEMVINW